MTALGRLKVRSMRLRAAVLLAALIAFAAHLAVTLARTETLDGVVLAVDVVLALLLLAAVYAHLHGLLSERRQHVMSALLLELTTEPQRIHETAGRALELLVDGGLAEAGVLAIARGGEWLPVAAYAYPEHWIDDAPRVARDTAPDAPRSLARADRHPWRGPIEAALGAGAEVVLVPVGTGDEPIGLLLLAARRRGPLGDRELLALTGRAVGAALHHAELFEAAYERERALEAQSRRHREVLSQLADEVRSPLASIASLAELVIDERPRFGTHPDRGRLLASLAHGVERLEQLANDLLDADGDEVAALEPAPQAVDLSQAIRLAETVLRPAFMLGEQSLTTELPDAPVTAYADPRHVEQVALNLLSHANRRTPMGGTVRVRLSRPDERTARIEVEDSGPALDAVERERVFETHASGETSGISGERGLGVARRLAALQHGRAWVEDGPAGGARFCVDLPATPGAVTQATARP